MEAATKKKRGRPDVFTTYYGEQSGYMRMVYKEMYGCDHEQRAMTNYIYISEGLRIATDELGEEAARSEFSTSKGNWKGAGILEQLGRMRLQNGYSAEDCTEILKCALAFREHGWTVRQIERWIRHGRNTGEF